MTLTSKASGDSYVYIMKNILVANIFGIGDVLFTTPLIVNLKKAATEVRVDYLCNRRTKSILKHNPDIEDIFVYEKDDFVSLWNDDRGVFLKKIADLFFAIRKKKYEVVFDFTLSRKFGFFFFLAGIKERIGFDYKRRGIFLTKSIPFSGFEGKHVVEHYLDLLKKMDVCITEREMQLIPGENDLEWTDRYLKEHALQEERLVAVIPGGGASWGKQSFRKRWSADKFLSVCDSLINEGIDVVILGDESEKELCEVITSGMKNKAKRVENNLSIDKYCALLSKCKVVLCNDGGPLHIAGALGVKTVSVFGPVDPLVYGPYPVSERNKVMVSKDLPCRPCYNKFRVPDCDIDNKCLEDISVGSVVRACVELMESK